jgi:hypothetical protein
VRTRLDQLIDRASWVTRRVRALPPSGAGRPWPVGTREHLPAKPSAGAYPHAERDMTGCAHGRMISAMHRFVDDDRGYLDWLVHHPDGFVINTGRTPSAAYLMLHRADCGTVNGRPARGTTFTGDYAKVCGEREELERFARQLGGHAQSCGLCLAQRGQLQRRASGGGKYDRLRDHLASSPGSRIRMTFAGVEELVGHLPDSAHRHRAWWGNNNANVEAKAWLDAGWRVESVDQAAGEVVFTRVGDGHVQTTRRPMGNRLTPYIDPQVSGNLAARAGILGLDPGKLVRLLYELNDNYSRGNAYAAHALLRAVLDHIPPLLGCASFEAAVNNYSWGRTDKKYARRLLDFKLQADDALHRQMSKRTTRLDIDDLPPKVWVNGLLQECADSK